MGAARPFEGKPPRGIDRAWVKRRTFARIFARLMDAGMSLRPMKAARQPEAGLHFSIEAPGETPPWEPTLTTGGVNIAAGCVTLAGAHLPYVLSGFVEITEPGFIAVRATLELPQWSIGSSGSTIRSEFAGWVTVISEPALAVVTEADQMIAETDWSPMTVDQMLISFPIAYVDPDNRRVIQLCKHQLGIGVLKNSDGMWPEAVYSFG